MSRYFDFRIQNINNSQLKLNYNFVIFIPPIEFIKDEFESYIYHLPLEKLSIDKLFFLISSKNYKKIKHQFTKDHIIERLPIHFRNGLNKHMSYIKYDEFGNLFIENSQVFVPLEKNLASNIIQSGLIKIFKDGKGILKKSITHHYILQSGKHSDQFIRTANVLKHGSRIDFIALSLLPFLKNSHRAIYCDTSSINALAYAIVKLKIVLTENIKGIPIPIVDSFHSYDGLDEKKFPFENKDECLVLISASTSGELSLGLINKRHIPENNIVTLYYLSERIKPRGKILCNLNQDDSFKAFSIENSNNCKLCKEQSLPIKITGEQFITEELTINPIEFYVMNLPPWYRKFMSQFHSKSVISCFYGNTSDETREIYLDLEKILKKIHEEFLQQNEEIKRDKFPTFQKKLKKKIESIVPLSTNRIIHMPDPSSKLFSEIIVAYLQKRYNLKENHIQILDYNSYSKKPEEYQINNGTTVVLASSIVTGRKLLTTSMLLRNDKCSLLYFVGIARTKNKNTLDDIKKYIGFDNDFGKNTNPLHFLESIHIPDDTNDYSYNTIEKRKKPSWVDEIVLIKSILNFIDNHEKHKVLVGKFLDRLETLNNAKQKGSNPKGLVDKLFWNTSNDENKRLKLRSNFAFYSGIRNKVKETSQADVYFTISSILHRFRTNENGVSAKVKIVQSEHHRSLISPKLFHCYNDGIIQAAILRASYPIELDYRVHGKNLDLATKMKNTIRSIFRNWNNPSGESTIEFLICLAMKRLKIPKNMNKEIIEELKTNAKESLLINCLCDYILINNLGLPEN